jgi:transposase
VVAASALYSEHNLATLAQTAIKWITRVPATLREAQAVRGHVDPQAMAPLHEDYRSQTLTSTDAGVAQRWVLIDSALRQAPAQRTVDKQRRTQSDQEGKALQQLCSTPLACEADARQALTTFAQTLQATFLATSTVHVKPR